MNATTKPNKAFWIIAVLALLWNLIGVYFWAMEYFFMTEEMKAAYPPEELELINSAPSWGIYVYAIAVFGGLLASILLLARKKMAVVIFGLSLFAILLLQGYWIFAMDMAAIMGPQSLIMPLIVIAIAIFEYFYSKGAAQNGWIV
ncbi:hypothetical protein [Aequorivita lipolytica]|uniref:Sugar transporter n=1 Tax=Aequorivita lipolytica TaxID=153267 RepID=A0A5C6YNS8_9FLAO|nr:hypothetical protein [Aequorivita lipolytica]TXD69091.1 hypothetical protein ESV24_08570 [Aequorivita lipolytica]SRX51340.1 hypothetical protein AEQU2_01820 [Aequorivita lipolytica]